MTNYTFSNRFSPARMRRADRASSSIIRALIANGVRERAAVRFALRNCDLSIKGQIQLAQATFRLSSRPAVNPV